MLKYTASLVWGWIRGIHHHRYWRMKCERCGFTGQVHYTGFYPCVRFKPPRGKTPRRT